MNACNGYSAKHQVTTGDPGFVKVIAVDKREGIIEIWLLLKKHVLLINKVV